MYWTKEGGTLNAEGLTLAVQFQSPRSVFSIQRLPAGRQVLRSAFSLQLSAFSF
jgi:hypothetical protein